MASQAADGGLARFIRIEGMRACDCSHHGSDWQDMRRSHGSALKDESVEVRDAAVRTLAAWSTPEALSTLLNIVKTSQLPEQRLLALQGYIRLLGIAGDRSPQQRLAGYEEAFQLATRLDEKRQVLAGLPRVRVPETLRFVLPLLADPELSEDAARAACCCRRSDGVRISRDGPGPPCEHRRQDSGHSRSRRPSQIARAALNLFCIQGVVGSSKSFMWNSPRAETIKPAFVTSHYSEAVNFS
jgi:hypothetical protein